MTKYTLHATINYPEWERTEKDKKERTAKEILEAISFELTKHAGNATSFVFVVAEVPQ